MLWFPHSAHVELVVRSRSDKTKNRFTYLFTFRIIIINSSSGFTGVNKLVRSLLSISPWSQLIYYYRFVRGPSRLAKTNSLHFTVSEDLGSDVSSSRAECAQRSIKSQPRLTVDTHLVIAQGLHGHALCFQMQNCTLRDYRDTTGIHSTIWHHPRLFSLFIRSDISSQTSMRTCPQHTRML